MKQYSFLQESIGRDLVGASRFSSRKNVAQIIMQKYPQPQMLADKLQQMAENSFGKEKETLLNLSLKCRGLDMNSYPTFANQISGFSSIWKYIGAGTATAGAALATRYLVNKAGEYAEQNPNATLGDKTKYAFNSAGKDLKHATDSGLIATKHAIGKIPGAGKLMQYDTVKRVNDNINNRTLLNKMYHRVTT